MGRIRTIKPEFFIHEELFDLEQETGLPMRVAYAGLFTVADKEGRFEWRPRRLKAAVLPYDDVDFSRVLDALATRGFLVRYASDGREYGAIRSWQKHQVINNREKCSEIPEPPQDIDEQQEMTRAPRVDDACPTPLGNYKAEGEGEGEREQDSEPIGSAERAEQLKERLFGDTARWLAKQAAITERTAKSFLGLCIRDHGEESTLNAAIVAHRHQAPDPRAYMRAVLDKGGGANGKDFSMTAVWKELDDEYRNESLGEPDHLETDDDAVREAPPH